MESSSDWDQKNLENELSLGMELARQLQVHLHAPSSSHEARELLVHKILNSYDKALTMLNRDGTLAMIGPQPNTGTTIGHSDSPKSFSGSPMSDDSDHDFKDPAVKTESKKRKGIPRWTQQVQICPGTGLEGPLDDGYNWRKYGQKDILGAKYPRSYYRCTHRNVQGLWLPNKCKDPMKMQQFSKLLTKEDTLAPMLPNQLCSHQHHPKKKNQVRHFNTSNK